MGRLIASFSVCYSASVHTRHDTLAVAAQLLTCMALVWSLAGCAEQFENPVVAGQDIRITFLHTSDIHSRLIPYDMTVLASDRTLGLSPDSGPFGGIARVAHIIERERARADRVVYVDSGDCFQGAPIFNVFHGEIEQIAMSQLRPDAVVIGNHEFDEGLSNYIKQLERGATYPLIAANYAYVPGNPLAELARPYHIANVGGVRIGFIGIANFSSISSITDVGNSLGIIALQNATILQEYVDFISPMVDLVVGVSHAGLTEDEEIIRETTGFDLIFGGHLHVALSPPKVIRDHDGRDVPLVHSGAFAKYVGKLDVVVRDGEVINHRYTLFPITATVPEDATMLSVLEPYKLILQQTIDLTSVFGYASKVIRRFGYGGGDSPLGNLVAEAIRLQARSDFAMTNTLGIRSDISEGPITLDSIFNVFPFNNTVTNMFVSGVDVQQLLDYVSERSAGRGCNSQVQVAGIQFTMNCNSASPTCPDCPRAEDIAIVSCSKPDVLAPEGCTTEPLQLDAIYEMSTNDYIAQGGSGFTILKSNNTQFDTELPMRDAVLEQFERSPHCVEECRTPDGRVELAGCVTYEGCVLNLGAFHDRFCRKLDVTDLEQIPSPYCGHDDQRCGTSEDCLKAVELCGDGSCDTCTIATDCDPAKCEGFACQCIDGQCVPDRMICLNGRCALTCSVDADCPNFIRTGEKLHLCIDGGCVPRAATACLDHAMCNPALQYCFGAGAPCQLDEHCADGEACEDRRCIPRRTPCAASTECPPAQHCRFGWCGPARPCDANCDGTCVDGTCQRTCDGCTQDSDCPQDESCVRGLCIPLVAECHEFRCRPRCIGQQGGASDCPAASTCSDQLCRPDACLEPRDALVRCRIKNETLNSERCVIIPCPRAESDGRIKTVLPTNLDDLPSDLNPDDPDG